jgi:D-glycero-alpha-D-manno-heptose-7-phosphate kinase
VIANIGTSRVSSRIIEEQQKNVIKKEDDVLEAMARLKEYAEVMKNGLLAGCVDVVGEVLRDSWEAKKRLAHSITTSQIDIIVANLLSAGAMGVKISGAGGGGFLTVYVKEEQRHCVVQALNTMGIVPLPFGFIDRGMEVWECERQ